ncbi:MAG: hypothetical protein ACOYBJ_02270 [Patescibacteria group bacterium]|jgi:hypothetical protein
MTTMTQVAKQAARRIWCAISRGVNHPQDCAPSEWLVGKIAQERKPSRVADAIWRLWQQVERTCMLPGFSRPLGSCYHPRVEHLLDIAYHYGGQAGEAFGRLNRAAAILATTLRGKWSWVDERGRCQQEDRTTGIALAPDLCWQLAEAIRAEAGPAVEAIGPEFFRPGWNEYVAAVTAFHAETEAKFAPLLGAVAGFDRELLDPTRLALCERIEEEPAWVGGAERTASNGTRFYELLTDGETRTVKEAPTASHQFGEYHPETGPAEVVVAGGTYMVQLVDVCYPRGWRWEVGQVLVTPNADPEKLAKALKRLDGSFGHGWH